MIIVAIPALNEERSIAKVVLMARAHVDKVLVCDDGSTDMTGPIAAALGAEVVRHPRNLGYGAALATLFRTAREIGADVLVTLDGDGQHDPNSIPNVIEPILRGDCDICIGSRFVQGLTSDVPKYRKVGIEAINALSR
jgi:glycosyltransferase involved in cell wall biosynthesis